MASWSVAIASEPEAVGGIDISADIPTIRIAPRLAGRSPMQLPDLPYAMVVNARCEETWRPVSLSISIADTSKSFGATQLQSNETLNFEVEVPSSQIAPVHLEKFCVEGQDVDDQDIGKMLKIPAILSMHVSLRCAADSEQSIRYVTEPLDVILECNLPEPAAVKIALSPE